MHQEWRNDGMIGVGTKDKPRPSLQTGLVNFLHPALQLVVAFKKIGKTA
jgi:hypothetical protein